MDEIYERFEELMNKQGKKPADITRETGISSTVLTEWKNGKSRPKADKMVILARSVETTVEYLVTGEINGRNRVEIIRERPQVLTNEEQLLVDGYRAASSERRGDMLDLAKKALKEKETQKSSSFTEREETA